MKKFSWVLGIVLLVVAVANGAETGKHLFILSGQSNMAGLHPDQSFTPAVEKAFGKDQVIVVKVAWSGCPIRIWYKDWKPAPDWKPQNADEAKTLTDKCWYWPELVKAMNNAAKGTVLKSVTFIWMQGESDALQRHEAVYEASLKGVIHQLETDLGYRDIHVVIGRISDFGVNRLKSPSWIAVREIQVRLAESNPRYAWVDTDDLNDGVNAKGQTIKDDLHYSVDGYRVLGERFAQKAIGLIKCLSQNPGRRTSELAASDGFGIGSKSGASPYPSGGIGPRPADSGAARPNILILLADDLGYGDVHCYNPDRGKIPTPNIDRLAGQGMRFTDGHSSAGACTPSRYSLLTGRYDWRSRLQRGVLGGFGKPLIPPERLTIAGLARQQGYRTACIGKWHLGMNWPIGPGEYRFLGTETLEQIQKASAKANETPTPSIEQLAASGFYDARPIAGYQPPTPTAEQLAAWQRIFSQPIPGGPTAVGFDHYFGVDVPGYPPYCFMENDRTVGIPARFLRAEEMLPAAMLGEWQGPATKDWDFYAAMPTMIRHTCDYLATAAQSKQPFLLYLALPAPHQPWAVTQAMRKKSGLSLYCDWVMETDAAVGEVLATLDKSGAAQDALVILVSDNGYSPYGVAELVKLGHYPSGPLRGFKAEAYEGGHREPFIVRWPGVVKPGTVCGQIVQQTDILATMADIFGLRLPDDAGEDSFSFLALLKGADKPVRPNSIHHSGQGGYAIRYGDWKLILEVDKKDRPPAQLFNLADDLGERKDLAAQFPERVAELRALMSKLVADGRSTPGPKQKNDAEVKWLREEGK